MRTWLFALGCVATQAGSLAGQRVWRASFYPYVYYSTIDGFWGAAHVGTSTALGFKERPEPHRAALNFDAGASTGGSYRVVADAQAPALWDGWRLRLTLTAARDNRLGFYGFGNDSPYVPDSVTDVAPFYYRVSRSRQLGRASVQRRLVGPLRLLVEGGIERTDFRALPGASVFRTSLTQGVVDSTMIPFLDPTFGVGLVLDTRDNELDPHGGVAVEGMFQQGKGYTRTTASARGFLPFFAGRLVLAARVAGENMGDTPPLAAQLSMESSERSFLALGGYESLRGAYDARWVGPGKLLGGIEARYAVVWVPTVVEVVLGGFYDAGRVFAPGEQFQLTTAGLHTSGGGEVGIRFLRNSLLILGVGANGEGWQLLFTTRWSY